MLAIHIAIQGLNTIKSKSLCRANTAIVSKAFQVCNIHVRWEADFAFVLWFVSYEREPIKGSSVERAARDGG
jgi:hypothetical protein